MSEICARSASHPSTSPSTGSGYAQGERVGFASAQILYMSRSDLPSACTCSGILSCKSLRKPGASSMPRRCQGIRLTAISGAM